MSKIKTKFLFADGVDVVPTVKVSLNRTRVGLPPDAGTFLRIYKNG